jgi:hypothetical protein
MPGTIYRDVYALPIYGLPAGDYTLRVGLYDPASGQRLSVGNGDGLRLQQVTLP